MEGLSKFERFVVGDGGTRLKASSMALKIGAGVILATAGLDLAIKAKRKESLDRQLAIQNRHLKDIERRESWDRDRFLDSGTYNSIVQNQFTNRIGHYKQGNSKYRR